jgi:hypothetical protein
MDGDRLAVKLGDRFHVLGHQQKPLLYGVAGYSMAIV